MNTSGKRSGRNHLLSLVMCVAVFAGMTGISGCHKQAQAGQIADASGPDPADVNMAPVDGSQPQAAPGQPVENESQQQADQYSQNGTQPAATAPAPEDQSDQSYANDQEDQAYNDQVDAGQDAVEEADQAPPPLPDYTQPPPPDPNYIWTPGYWSYAPGGYYWVPGAWVAAPYPGALWTPGYWGFYGGRYRFYRGYWGLHIGFYGGVPYGYGYPGTGYYGGYWNGNNFYYNRAVTRIDTNRIRYVYSRPVIVHNRTRISFNGGRGGIQARPNRSEMVAMRGPRVAPMTAQLQNERQAAQNRRQFFNQNRGRPATAVSRPLVADHGIQRPVARPIQSGRQQTRPGQSNQIRPGQSNQIRPGQPNQARPMQPNQPNRPQTRPVQPQQRPNQPQARPEPQRPTQPEGRPNNQHVSPNQPQLRQQPPAARPNGQPQQRQEQQNQRFQQQRQPQQLQQQRIVQQRPQPQQLQQREQQQQRQQLQLQQRQQQQQVQQRQQQQLQQRQQQQRMPQQRVQPQQRQVQQPRQARAPEPGRATPAPRNDDHEHR